MKTLPLLLGIVCEMEAEVGERRAGRGGGGGGGDYPSDFFYEVCPSEGAIRDRTARDVLKGRGKWGEKHSSDVSIEF